MLHKLKQRNASQGFTIIEVMIVLAIAAMILLVVLLAVPALQRNSRNSTLKNDVGIIQGTINDYATNNNGTQPTYVAASGGVLSVGTSSSDTNMQKGKIQGGTAVTYSATAGAQPSGTGVSATQKTAIGSVYILKGYNCDGTASSRAYSIWYVVEISGNTNQQCADATA